MRILVPLNTIEHFKDYVEAGAEEFYFGFYDQEWTKRFGEYSDINRLTGFKETANPYNFEQLIEKIRWIKRQGKSIYVTFNASIYSQEELKVVEAYMERLEDTGLDGVIVSCTELVQIAKKVGIPSVVSTIGGVYNSDLARFYADFGARRIILPRDLSIDEIESLTKMVPEVEYEVFLMRNGCVFSDSNCLGMHRNEMCSICTSIKEADDSIMISEDNFTTRHEVELNHQIYNDSFHHISCGLCAIYRFIKMNIAAGKIVGRSDEWQNICKDIRDISHNIEIAKTCSSQEEYLEKMNFPKNRRSICKLALSCYYPEVRF